MPMNKSEMQLTAKELRRRARISANAKINPNYGMRGKHHSEESKAKMSRASEGQIPWMKGRKGIVQHTEEFKAKMSKRMSGENNPFYGRTHTEETKKKLKLFRKGMPSLRKGVKLSKEVIEKTASKLRGRRPSREIIRKRLRRRTPSGLEKKMIGIIKKFNLPYKFVGNGSFFVEKYNPDFINTNGEKKVIEVFCIQHKRLFRGGIEEWKKERREVFERNGWELLFLDATRVNDKLQEVL